VPEPLPKRKGHRRVRPRQKDAARPADRPREAPRDVGRIRQAGRHNGEVRGKAVRHDRPLRAQAARPRLQGGGIRLQQGADRLQPDQASDAQGAQGVHGAVQQDALRAGRASDHGGEAREGGEMSKKKDKEN